MEVFVPYLLLTCLLVGGHADTVVDVEDSLDGEPLNSRNPKLFGDPLGILSRQSCEHKGDEGDCTGEVACLALAGQYGAFCGGLRGICCLFYRTCGQRTSQRVVHFRNSQWPLEHQDPNDCSFRIIKRDTDYCGLTVRAKNPEKSKTSRHCDSTNVHFVGTGKHRRPLPLCRNGRASAIEYKIDISDIEELSMVVNSTTRTSAAWNLEVKQEKCSDFSGESDNTINGVEAEPDTSSSSSGSSGGSAQFPPPVPGASPAGPPAPPPQDAPSVPTTTTTTTTTTTRRPSLSSSDVAGRCGIKGRSTNSVRNDFISEGYYGVNRKKVPPGSSSFDPQGPVVIAKDNPFLTELTFTGPDTSSSNFAYWKGPESLLTNRVTYGDPASPNEYPWQVAMFIGGRYHCGGSIIGDYWLMTAAHCVISYRHKPSVLRLSLGDYDVKDNRDGPYIEAKAEKVIVHPSYSRSTLQNDIAIIKVIERIEYSDRVKPICLPATDIRTDEKIATITGWGRDENRQLKTVLQELTSKVVTNDQCSRQWQLKKAPPGFIVNTMMCMDSSQGDSCNGDSGGPSVMEYPSGSGTFVQVGIVSFGSGSCTDKNLPGVYTRVSEFRDWIRQQMR